LNHLLMKIDGLISLVLNKEAEKVEIKAEKSETCFGHI
jgi:hypothetical protein